MKMTVPERAVLVIYLLLMNLFFPVALLVLFPFLIFKEKRRRTLLPRLGIQSIEPTKKQPLWIHALSLGEILSCVPLVKELRKQVADRPIYFSVSTLSGWEIVQDKLAGQYDRLLYFPYDLLWPVHRCIRRINPCLFVLIETDIWPGFLTVIRRRRIPCLLLNGRVSPSTLKSFMRFSWLFRPALNTFSLICPQSTQEAKRYQRVGVIQSKIGPCGNLKFDIPMKPSSETENIRLKESLGFSRTDPIFLAGSTHPGEEDMICSAFQKLRKTYPELKLLSVPRKPHRADQVANIFIKAGYRVGLYTGKPCQSVDVHVVNVQGKLARLYEVVDVAFVGGSLVPRGGQNPIEPAVVGKPVLFGPDMSNFPDISRSLLDNGCAWQIRDEKELYSRLNILFGDPKLSGEMGEKGRSVVRQHWGTTRRLTLEILKMMDAADGERNK